jgi:hypothetical protein
MPDAQPQTGPRADLEVVNVRLSKPAALFLSGMFDHLNSVKALPAAGDREKAVQTSAWLEEIASAAHTAIKEPFDPLLGDSAEAAWRTHGVEDLDGLIADRDRCRQALTGLVEAIHEAAAAGIMPPTLHPAGPGCAAHEHVQPLLQAVTRAERILKVHAGTGS